MDARSNFQDIVAHLEQTMPDSQILQMRYRYNGENTKMSGLYYNDRGFYVVKFQKGQLHIETENDDAMKALHDYNVLEQELFP